MLSLAAACCGCSAWAQPAAVVRLALGTATVAHPASGTSEPIVEGLAIGVGDVIQTAKDGYVHALFGDASLLAVRPDSAVRIAGFSANDNEHDALWLELMTGAFRCVTGWVSKVHPNAAMFTTRNVTAGIRGTDFEVVHIDEAKHAADEIPGTHALVHEGEIVLETQAGRLELHPGESGFASRAQEPPRLHPALPAFMQARAAKTDALVDEHARHIEEHMEKAMKERGLMREGQSVKEHLDERRRAEKAEPSEKSEKPEHRTPPTRPEKPERPERPERLQRKG